MTGSLDVQTGELDYHPLSRLAFVEPRRSLGLPGVAGDPCMAGRIDSVQTKRRGNRVGDPSTGYDDGHIHHHFRKISQTSIRRNPVSDLHLLRFAPMELFLPMP